MSALEHTVAASANRVETAYALLTAAGWQQDTKPGRWILPGTRWRAQVRWEWTSLYWLTDNCAQTLQRWRTQDIRTIQKRLAKLTASVELMGDIPHGK